MGRVETSTHYFIACACCYEIKDFHGGFMTKDDQVVWLWEEEGYPACSLHDANAKHFSSAQEIMRDAAKWDGMPWYYKLKPGTLRIFEIRTKQVTESSKQEVDVRTGAPIVAG